MQNVVWMAWFVGVLLLHVTRPRLGAQAFLVATLIAPFGIFEFTGGRLLRVELALIPLLLACQVMGLTPGGRRFRLPPVSLLLIAWISWIGLLTLMVGEDINYIGFYGNARLVAVLVVFANIHWTDRDIENSQFLFVLTAIPIAILCCGQFLGVGYARAITEAAFNPTSSVVLEAQRDAELGGATFRALGVFGNVSPTGAYFLIALTLGIVLYSYTPPANRSRRLLLMSGLAASVCGGLFTLSGTFIGGFAPAVLVALFFAPPSKRSGILRFGTLFVALAGAGTYALRSASETVDVQLAYQWTRLTEGVAFEGRYSRHDSVHAQAYDEFLESPWLGCGLTQNTFTADSLYIAILHKSGILGSLLFVFPVVFLMMASVRAGPSSRLALFWTLLMMIVGVGCSGMFVGRLGDWWWAAQGMLLSQLAAPAAPRVVARLPNLSGRLPCREGQASALSGRSPYA